MYDKKRPREGNTNPKLLCLLALRLAIQATVERIPMLLRIIAADSHTRSRSWPVIYIRCMLYSTRGWGLRPRLVDDGRKYLRSYNVTLLTSGDVRYSSLA